VRFTKTLRREAAKARKRESAQRGPLPQPNTPRLENREFYRDEQDEQDKTLNASLILFILFIPVKFLLLELSAHNFSSKTRNFRAEFFASFFIDILRFLVLLARFSGLNNLARSRAGQNMRREGAKARRKTRRNSKGLQRPADSSSSSRLPSRFRAFAAHF
jgi:hypothetical protein